MSSRNRSEDLLDIKLQHALKNWVAHAEAPKGGRDQLLAVAAQQQVTIPKQKIIKFNFGWSSYYNGNLREAAVHSLHGYAIDALIFKTGLGMVVR